VGIERPDTTASERRRSRCGPKLSQRHSNAAVVRASWDAARPHLVKPELQLHQMTKNELIVQLLQHRSKPSPRNVRSTTPNSNRRSVLQQGPPVPELRPLLACCIAAQICTLECLLYHVMLRAPSVNSPALRQPTQRKTTRPRQTPGSPILCYRSIVTHAKNPGTQIIA
jgi:hypothetical protein